MTVSITIEEITPQVAAELLEKNTTNRRMRRSRIETYARDMTAGRWRMNGDPIRFNGDGRLIDGQHRLMACMLSQKPFSTAVARGITDSAHATIDTGAARTMADELRWMGEPLAAELAAILGLVWGYDQGAQWALVGSRSEKLALFRKDPAIRDSLKAVAIARRFAGRGTALSAAHYIMAREHGSEAADSFLAELEAGTDYSEGDACLALRTWAATISASRLHRPVTQEWLAIFIKGMNAWLLGLPVKQLRWRRVGANKEPFPQIVTRDEVSG